jgi:hypothetical protein
MALEEFERDPMSERRKGLTQMRSITNYGMGIFIIVVGCFFMFPNRYSENFLDKYDPALIKIFAFICWVYGIFRVYRGYKKNYFRD